MKFYYVLLKSPSIFIVPYYLYPIIVLDSLRSWSYRKCFCFVKPNEVNWGNFFLLSILMQSEVRFVLVKAMRLRLGK